MLSSPELIAGILEYSCAFGIMDSPIRNVSDAKSSYHSSSLSSITFVEDDLKLSSPSLTIVQKDVDLVEWRIDKTGQERPGDLHSLLQEMGFTFFVAMSQVLTVTPSGFRRRKSLIDIGVFCIRIHCHFTWSWSS